MNEKCKICPLLETAQQACPGQRNTGVCKRADTKSPDHAPGILRQILNFGMAVVHHAAQGMPMATEEQKNARMAVCRACEWFDGDKGGCRKCGCSMDMKAGWADRSCPLDPPKWGPVVPINES